MWNLKMPRDLWYALVATACLIVAIAAEFLGHRIVAGTFLAAIPLMGVIALLHRAQTRNACRRGQQKSSATPNLRVVEGRARQGGGPRSVEEWTCALGRYRTGDHTRLEGEVGPTRRPAS